jgi:hypothetical protein
MMHLFIGGPADGAWYDIPAGRDTWEVTERLPSTSPDYLFRRFQYVRMPWRGAELTRHVFVEIGLKPDRVLDLLLEGYVPAKVTQGALKLAADTLNNIYAFALREHHRGRGTLDKIPWETIIRFCEGAGCKSSPLRSTAETPGEPK